MRAALLTLLCLVASLPARAEIALAPLRQVITEEARTVTYRLSNPSRRIVEGRVSWIDMVATETGYAPASAEDRSRISAAPYLTVWPAFFKLEPGASATITVAARGTIPNGERRSHLLIETGAARTPLRRAGGLELDIGLGVSTPVVLRGGEGEARARIGDTRLLRDRGGLLELSTTVMPDGDFSAYGRLNVRLTSRDGDVIDLASLDNAAAWNDAERRRFSLPLGVNYLPPGVLEIVYAGRAEFDGRVFARRSFEVAPPK
ncbi:MAG: hypothetical protein RIC52_14835 [Amphiplicatus sp.]